ncbi:uncharacterized protein LOC128743724 [Sabethes cyaneus]|uniref:uncharacterized protein LOC128743724 n=1 Tax=Sabethes cyaneus TaxID=53552 RepID=UPI00237DD08C|nr:uncharacterized protein LOC128743724 [Sabethes cyaneus]
MLTFSGFTGTILPIIAIGFVAIIALVNLFLSLRKRFPVRVNCWFCNQDSRVPYDNSNSWVCPKCTQYNGFNEDGDYNREIPEQYQCRLNPRSNITDDDKISYSAPSNGLCFGCNRNQELKIYQLASFVPEMEENYDAEVEEYQLQLEQTYKLCSRCDRVLNRTLNEVKRNILGSKLAQIGIKGLKVFDLHMAASDKKMAIRKQQTVANVCLWMIIALLTIKLGQHLAEVEINKDRLEIIFSSAVSQTVLIAVSYFVAFKDTLVSLWEGIWGQPTIANWIEQFSYLKKLFIARWMAGNTTVADNICEALNNTPETMAVATQSNVLSDLALIALACMLLGAKSYIGSTKPVVLILCGLMKLFLRTDPCSQFLEQGVSCELIEVFLSTVAFATAIGCIGQTAPKIQPSDNLNSSFHKIYSQETAECDNSDSSEHLQHQLRTSVKTDVSNRSLDSTKSISPSVLTSSITRPLFDDSCATQATPKSSFGGPMLDVNRLNTTLQQHSPKRTFSRQSFFVPESSLLKTPSFSVDNFTTAMGSRPESNMNNASQKFHGYYSMSALNTATLQEDRFGEDIDRLSISGRLSVSRRDLSVINNPFTTHHVDPDEGFSLRHRKVTVSPPKLCAIAESGNSWIAGGYWGMAPQNNRDAANPPGFVQQPLFMSRTSSQSSGFESQPTRRPTPEEPPPLELDRVSLFSEPVAISNASVPNAFHHRLNQSVNFPAVRPHPSPVPSFISFAGSSSKINSGFSNRNLFGERNLFQTNPPSAMRTAMPFPLHQSQTPPVFRGGGLASTASSFVPISQSPAPGGERPSNSHRRSLLNLSKLGELPETTHNHDSQEDC